MIIYQASLRIIAALLASKAASSMIRRIIALSVTSSGMNCAQVQHFRCRLSLAHDPRLSRHVSRGVNCHPQHASVTCPLSARASERASEQANERALSRTLLRTIVCKSARIARAVGRTGVSPAIVYLSVPGLEGRSR